EFRSRFVVERSVRRLCMALNRLAEASAIVEIRLAACKCCEDSQALSENWTMVMTVVIRITALSNAETLNLLSIMAPKITSAIWPKKSKILGSGIGYNYGMLLKKFRFLNSSWGGTRAQEGR